jgi:hypothetical protein
LKKNQLSSFFEKSFSENLNHGRFSVAVDGNKNCKGYLAPRIYMPGNG